MLEAGESSVKSDVYAFAVVILELFTRTSPFGKMNPHQGAFAWLRGGTPAVRAAP